MIAPKTRMQPMPSVNVKVSLSSSQPDMAANTDSKLISREAVVGSMAFCPTICAAAASTPCGIRNGKSWVCSCP